MPSTTAEEIFGTFPEFVDQDPTVWLEIATAEQEDLWGDVRYQYAIALRAAHAMEVAGLGSTGVAGTGGVTSKHIGSLSVSYASPSSSGGVAGTTLDDTRYGRLLAELLVSSIVPAVVDCGPGLCGRDDGWSTSTGMFAWHRRGWWW